MQPVFDRYFNGVDEFSYGLAGVFADEEVGFIDATGQMRLLLPEYKELNPFNQFGLAIANRDLDARHWDLDIIDRSGNVHAGGFQTAVYWEGDFPYFEVSKDGPDGQSSEEQIFDMNMNRIY